MFISAHEPGDLKKLFREPWEISSCPDPEDWGADFLWFREDEAAGKVYSYGVQRKKFPDDFISSLHGEDSRLNREILQMQELDFRILLLEGNPQWGADGMLINRRHEFSYWRLQAMSWSLCRHWGIFVQWSRDHHHTFQTILKLYSWTMKPTHEGFGLRNQPKLVKDKETGLWVPSQVDETGQRMPIDWMDWIWQGFPGVGLVNGRRINNYCRENGIVGLHLDPALRLEQIPGIGPEKAGKIREVLTGSSIDPVVEEQKRAKLAEKERKKQEKLDLQEQKKAKAAARKKKTS